MTEQSDSDPSAAPNPPATPEGWYPDPSGDHELRWWDGAQWTQNVSDHGKTSTAPVTVSTVPLVDKPAEKIRRQVESQAGVHVEGTGGGTIFTEPVLVVNQKVKLIELNNEYAVYDADGNQIAAVRQVGQSALKKAARLLTSLDQFMTHSLQIVDMSGNVLLTVTRPRKVLKSKVEIGDASGNQIGRVIQKNAIGKIRFDLEAGGQVIGSLNAENWRAWNFSIKDASGQEVARITKTWEGLARTLFTTADNYVLQIERPLEQPMLSLVVASALSVDTALKQDARGFG